MAKLELGMISSTWLGTEVGVEEGIRQAKAIGFDTYDIFQDALDLSDAERAEIKAWCAAAGLSIRSQVCVAFGLTDFNPAVQRFTPPRLIGRTGAATNLLLDGPQTASIAVGAVLASVVDYRVLLIAVAVVIGSCSAWLFRVEQRVPEMAAAT